MSSPTQRSLALLRKDGWLAQVVEKWVAQAKRRVDLFGVGDVIAVKDEDTLLVQVTSASNVSARVRKIAESESVPRLREAGWLIHVHGWRKNAQGRWVCRVVDVS